MTPLVFFTIASRNYLAYALTLMQSVAAQHPESRQYLCLVDKLEADAAIETGLFDVVTIDQLDLPRFDAFVFRYDIMELNTAVKPYMFEWLRMRHPQQGLVYLDPDIYVVRPLSEVAQAFQDGKLAVLTPHLNAPLPDDGKFPTELSLMRTGVYNCGFVAINAAHPQSAKLIDWWSRKLEFDCFVDLEAGLFTDQKWMDLVPGMFPDVAILRHDGYNLAYWNLASRAVASDRDGWTVNGSPLVFAHFSGVDASHPEVFSKHQNRFDAENIGGLRALYDQYLQCLRDNDHAQHARAAYAYGAFADGEKIAPVLRRTYRRYFDVCGEDFVPRPFQMDRERFNEACPELPDVPGLPISKVMYETWRAQESLREAFAVRSFEGREAYVRWYLDGAAASMRLGERYVAPIRTRFKTGRAASPAARRGIRARAGATALRAFDWGKRHSGLATLYGRLPFAWRMKVRQRLHSAAGVPMPPLPFEAGKVRTSRIDRAPVSSGPGVNLLGYVRGEFGIAENVRSYARALEKGAYPFALFNFDVGAASRQNDRSMDRHLSDELRYATNVFFINADQMSVARGFLGRDAFAGRYNIGFWVWELDKFPADWKGAFDLVDEIWAPTKFVRDAIAGSTSKPVLRMPKAIEFDVPAGLGRAHFGLRDDAFVFLFSYDFNSFAARKNPEAAIAAFRQAFSNGARDVKLLVKSTNGDKFPERLEALRRSVADDARIEVRDGFFSREEMSGLQNCIDCFVSLHRSEGFGLGMAECMYLGKPVIATGYSGNLDFMDRDNSLLVDCTMIPVKAGEYPCWKGQHWAEPDIAHAAQLMRQVCDDGDFARKVGARAAESIRLGNSRAVCAAAMLERLAEIDRRRPAA